MAILPRYSIFNIQYSNSARRPSSARSGQAQLGFTLMELITVFAIIAVLATVMLGSNLISTRLRARDTVRKSDLAQIGKALEAYISDHGVYPNTTGASTYRIMGCGAGSDNPCDWGGQFVDENNTTYIVRIPQDSKAPNGSYAYVAAADGSAWQLFARLENENDPVLDRNGDGSYTTADDYPLNCGDDPCNYGISSHNTTPDSVL